ncbi:MAG: hypothetical protein HQL93_09300 [Magnetococcales bacterium]|nr:hypothetical protein [Magnetococcales bacterium]
MTTNPTMHLRDTLMQEDLLFFYSGYVTEQIMVSIGDAIRDLLALNNTAQSVANTLFTIFIEQAQNIIRYSAEYQTGELNQRQIDLRYGVLAIGYKEDGYYIACSNAIIKQDVARLQEKLTHIKTLDRSGLKALHKEILKGQIPEGSKGAGVGFIDIARLATRGFEFEFLETSDTLSYFVLKAYI